MAEYPNIHSFKAIETYWTLHEKLMSTKDQDEIEDICWKMITYTRPALEEQKQYNDQYKQAAIDNAILLEMEYKERKEMTFVTAEPFKRFAIVCEKKGNLPQAIWACKQAISLNLTDDGTKGGMQGRLDKLMKKV